MTLFNNPPTTSGIIVLSGSLGFDEALSDFPMTIGSIESLGQTEFGFPSTISGENLFGLLALDTRITQDIVFFGQSPPTTSGIVLWVFGDNTPFAAPIVFNARLFPIFQGNIPAQDKRLFPILPQFATFIP